MTGRIYIALIAFTTGFTSYSLKSQFYSLPASDEFAFPVQKILAAPDPSVHTGFQPYIPFLNSKYAGPPDSNRVFRFIKNDPFIELVFHRHLVQIAPKNEKFSLRLDPLLNLQYGRDLADSTGLEPYTNTRGFIGSGHIGERFYFETMLAENQSVFPEYIAGFARATKVVPGQGRWKNFKSRGFDYAFSSGFASVQLWKNVNLQFGHGKHKVGSGYRSLLLSDNAFNYPYARLTQTWFRGRLQYTNVYASLMNLRPASTVLTANAEPLFQKKPAAFQHLSINLHPRVNLSFFQGMIWRTADERNRQELSWQYFNPLIFSNLLAYGLNDHNNIVAGADLLVKLSDRLSVYTQLMADDMREGAGVQAGIKWFDAFSLKGLSLQLEGNQAGSDIYRSPVTIADQGYTHYNQVLGTARGSGREVVGIANYRNKRFTGHVKYNYQEPVAVSGVTTYVNLLNAGIGYVINPSYNLNAWVGLSSRTQKISTFSHSNRTNYLYVALRTSIYNMYYDF